VDDEALKIARIGLLEKVLWILKEAMNLIGMVFVERM
jgi:arginyl-tRNA synthetase